MTDHDLIQKNQDDFIRRGDALQILDDLSQVDGCFGDAHEAIAALPPAKLGNLASGKAVTVGVSEAVIHRSVLDWIREDTGAAIKMTITPDQANALTGRIFAALEPVSAPRRYMGQIMAECDCSRQSECEAAQRCLAAPDPAHHVNKTLKDEHDAGNVLTPDTAPAQRVNLSEAEAIREAALREAAEMFGPIVRDAILALIQKPQSVFKKEK